ncbi:MAG: O-antigen ligase domain-containing protein, partial [Flavobacterium sp.]
VQRDLVLFFLLFFVLMLSGGRSAFIGFCLGFGFIILFMKNKYRYLLIFSGFVGYLFMVSFPGYFSLLNRQEAVNDAFEVRYNIWNEAISVFLQHPFLGIGIGNYIDYVALYTQGGYYIIDDQIVYYGTENGYLKILTEAGILGFITILFLLVRPVVQSWIAIRKSFDSWNQYFLIAAVLSWGVSFNSLYTLSDKRIVVLLATILCFMIYLRKKSSALYGY